MTILITGSNGITARRLTALLYPRYPLLIASRSVRSEATSPPRVRFDWKDPKTFTTPFEHAQAQRQPITAVYLVAPTGEQDVTDGELTFISLAADRGVKRFVLLGSSMVPEGGPFMGQVHKRLREMHGVEWAVLRPSWFMENFSEQQHLPTILHERKIYTATGRGRLPFCSADDIAATAFHALTSPSPPDREFFILGPDLLSYADVARILTDVIGEEVTHVDLSSEGLIGRLMAFGVSRATAELLAGMDERIRRGAEERTGGDVEDVLGRPPRSLRRFAEDNRGVWVRDFGHA